MIWIKRALLALPFGIAAALNLLAIIARPMHWHTEHIAGYGFLFATPWAWLRVSVSLRGFAIRTLR